MPGHMTFVNIMFAQGLQTVGLASEILVQKRTLEPYLKDQQHTNLAVVAKNMFEFWQGLL